MRTYSENYIKEIHYELVKLFLESYFDLCFCGLLGVLSFYRDSGREGIMDFL
jgi:hypothetical protein